MTITRDEIAKALYLAKYYGPHAYKLEAATQDWEWFNRQRSTSALWRDLVAIWRQADVMLAMIEADRRKRTK
jgi:hypothetical protein